MLLRFGALLVILACVQAQTAKKETSSMLDAILCIVNPKPSECAREQAGRLLVSWSEVIEAKKQTLIAEADVELQKHIESRGIKDSMAKQQEKPSFLLKAIENGLETMSEVIADGVDDYVDEDEDSEEVDEVKTTNTLDGNSKSAAEQLGKHGIKIKIKKHGTARGGGNSGLGGGDKKGGGFGGGKKKKRQQLMKLVLLGATIKAKIELFLRVLSFHLQVKFFAIAAIGLIINIVRLWVDAKKGHQPQKVIYYEHAQHQHHYDEHDDWSGGSGSPSYWKRASTGHSDAGPEYYESRSFKSDSPVVNAHNLAYNGQKH